MSLVMPKLKTNKAAAKRFKVSSKGKIRRNASFGSHILTKKSTKRKRKIRRGRALDKADLKRVKSLLPYA